MVVEQRLLAADEAEARLPATAPDPTRGDDRVPAVPDAVLIAVPADEDDPFVGDVVLLLQARYAQRAQEGVDAGGYDAEARKKSARRHFGTALASVFDWCVLKVRELILGACHRILGGRGDTGQRVQASLERVCADPLQPVGAMRHLASNLAAQIESGRAPFDDVRDRPGESIVPHVAQPPAGGTDTVAKLPLEGLDSLACRTWMAEQEPRQDSCNFATREAIEANGLRLRDGAEGVTLPSGDASGAGRVVYHVRQVDRSYDARRQAFRALDEEPPPLFDGGTAETVARRCGAQLIEVSTEPIGIKAVRSLVLCCDEKTQCRALERTQPGLPLGPGPYPDADMDCAHDTVRVHQQVASLGAKGAIGLSGALPGSVPVARRSDAGRGGPVGRDVLLRAGRAQGHRRRRLG